MKIKPLMNGFHIDIGNRTILIFQRFGDKFHVFPFMFIGSRRRSRVFKDSGAALEFVCKVIIEAGEDGWLTEEVDNDS